MENDALQPQEIRVSIAEVMDHLNLVGMEMDIATFSSGAPDKLAGGVSMRLDGLLFILVKEGRANINIDLGEYKLEKNSLAVIQPRNYVRWEDISPDFRSHCIICTTELIENVLPKLTDVLPILIHTRMSPVARLCENDARGIDMFYDFLSAKLRGPKTPFLKKKLLCVLEAALLELMDIQLQMNGGRPGGARTRKEELMAKFLLAVNKEFMTNREVAYYADKLCISTKHLSTTVKEVSGRTPGEWIENYVVLEAKLLLRTTDMTIQEIARKLNFASQSFFGKYFKNVTGISPTLFRRQA